MLTVPVVTSTWRSRFEDIVRFKVHSPPWRHGHSCVAEAHDHSSCTQGICLDEQCPASSCHVAVMSPTPLTRAYDWRHHVHGRSGLILDVRRTEPGQPTGVRAASPALVDSILDGDAR